MGINTGFFVSDDRIQKYSDPKKNYKMKLSSLSNVSNASNKSEEFSLNDIEVVVDGKEQNWFKRAHLGKCSGIRNIRRSMTKLANEEQKT